MQQQTSISLYQYWDDVRHGRIAPSRSDIEPSDISALLADIFIIDCSGAPSHRFRLAGTQICEHLGRELRSTDFLDLFGNDDRDALESLLCGVVQDASIGVTKFDAIDDTSRRAQARYWGLNNDRQDAGACGALSRVRYWRLIPRRSAPHDHLKALRLSRAELFLLKI